MSEKPGVQIGPFTLSREIRLGDVLTIVGVALMVTSTLQRFDMRLDFVERATAAQVDTNKQIRLEQREATEGLHAEVREVANAVRRVEDKINRARL